MGFYVSCCESDLRRWVVFDFEFDCELHPSMELELGVVSLSYVHALMRIAEAYGAGFERRWSWSYRRNLWQSVQVAAEHCCSDEQLKWLWGDAGYVCKTVGGSCVIITGNPRKIASMNMEFRMDGLCKNGYAA
ncbi:hypothetical protein C5167_023273 [Papaver somniferum]|uniref:Uncharacterized protein n=1 Tax=Papaver somniferum TaxID=3469 RepID=A0A4Y7JPA5_PAPSO|nr:hypothetical protein C5167_023273 [Papaver somniferum]